MNWYIPGRKNALLYKEELESHGAVWLREKAAFILKDKSENSDCIFLIKKILKIRMRKLIKPIRS